MLIDFKKDLAHILGKVTHQETNFILNLFENPKNMDHGHLAFPVFFMARQRRKSPPRIAQELALELENLNLSPVRAASPVGGYVNIHLKDDWLQQSLVKKLRLQGEEFGFGQGGKGKTVVIDFSSPNVAKPMSVGHLRATVIGQAMCHLARSQGYEVIALNHLGDWGVQFGKLAWAYEKWKSQYSFDKDPFEALFSIYVRFHEAAEEDPQLNIEGSLMFKKLEEGDPQVVALWNKFVEISMKEYKEIWDILGVKFDLVRGESFYNNRLKPTEKLIEDKGLLEESDGAQVVRLDEEGMPPCLIRKSDGASLYATRDIASAIYRMEELGADSNLYVVGMDQSLHFKQVFRVIEKMGYPWAKDCHHISFGMYRFKETKMSTRKGNVIFLRDVVERAVELVQEIMESRKVKPTNVEEVARQVGIGAIVFNDLFNDRMKDIDFHWDKVLDLDGNSGPYVQYSQVRCHSLMKKYGKEIPEIWPAILESPEERALVKVLHGYEETLTNSFTHFKPHFMANYLIEVCQSFGNFYHKHRILGEPSDIEASRMGLVAATQKILQYGLRILNIESPEEM